MLQKIKNVLIQIIPTIIVAIFFLSLIVYAWTEPHQAPPGGNVDAPLNVSLNAQAKEGGLILGFNPSVTIGLLVLNGNVGIGTTSPSYKLDVNGDVRWSGTLQGGSVPWARLTNFPADCGSNQYVYGFGAGGTLKCSNPLAGGSGKATSIYLCPKGCAAGAAPFLSTQSSCVPPICGSGPTEPGPLFNYYNCNGTCGAVDNIPCSCTYLGKLAPY